MSAAAPAPAVLNSGESLITRESFSMSKTALIRIRFSDGTQMELPENESVQVVIDGPGDKPKEGWARLNGDKTPALYGKANKLRAAALTQGQQMMTFRGVLLIDGARRV